MTTAESSVWPSADGVVSEDELRRYIRHASVLIASAPDPEVEALLPDRIRILRSASNWLESAQLGITQLLHESEHRLARTETLHEPLTAPLRPATMPPRSRES